MDSPPRPRMNGTQLRHSLDLLSKLADQIVDGDFVLVLCPADQVSAEATYQYVPTGDPDACTDAFLRGVAALEAYREICEAPDAPRTHEIDRFLAAKSAGEATRIDSVKIARFARRLTSGLAEAAATALDEPDEGAVA